MEEGPNNASFNQNNPSPGSLVYEDAVFAERQHMASALGYDEDDDESAHSHKQAVAREQAYSSRAGLLMTLSIARWAIRQAAGTETNPRVRRQRESILLDRWRRFSGDLALMPYLRRKVIF